MYKRQALWEAQQQLNAPRTRTGKIRALQESAALFSFLQANGIQSMQQLHEKIADMNSRYYDLRGKIVKAERRIATPVSYTHLDVYKRQYSHCSGDAGCSTECRYIEKAQAFGCCPKESRRTGKTDLQNL